MKKTITNYKRKTETQEQSAARPTCCWPDSAASLRPASKDALLQKLPGRRCTGHSCSEPTWAPAGPSLQHPQLAPQSSLHLTLFYSEPSLGTRDCLFSFGENYRAVLKAEEKRCGHSWPCSQSRHRSNPGFTSKFSFLNCKNRIEVPTSWDATRIK